MQAENGCRNAKAISHEKFVISALCSNQLKMHILSSFLSSFWREYSQEYHLKIGMQKLAESGTSQVGPVTATAMQLRIICMAANKWL